jgi:hypothetical protein
MAAIYYSPSIRRHELWSLVLVGAIAVLAPAAYGITLAYYGYTRYGPVAASAWSTPWLIAAAGLFAAWLSVFLLLVRRSRYGVILHRNGLYLGDVETPPGGSPGRPFRRMPNLIPWEAVTGIAVELIASTAGRPPVHRVFLHFQGGRRLSLAEALPKHSALAGLFGPVCIENLPELITRLKARLYPRLQPGLRAAFQSGKPVSFGKVAVQQEGFIYHKTLAGFLPARTRIPWDKINRLTVQSGDLVVELENHKGRRFPRIPVSKIPNLELLLTLIDSTQHWQSPESLAKSLNRNPRVRWPIGSHISNHPS